MERLFSIGKDIFRAKRAALSDENFEMLMFLKGSFPNPDQTGCSYLALSASNNYIHGSDSVSGSYIFYVNIVLILETVLNFFYSFAISVVDRNVIGVVNSYVEVAISSCILLIRKRFQFIENSFSLF